MLKHRYNTRGVSVVEYALLAALIGTASVLAVTTFGAQTAALFEREDLRLADSNGGGDSGSGGSTGSGDGLGDHRATQNLDMSLFRIVNVNDPLNPSDAATKSYVDASVASISADGDDLGNHTATQNLDLATNRIVNLGAPLDDADATTKAYVDAAIAGIPGGDNLGDHIATQNIALGDNWLSNDGSQQGLRVGSSGRIGIGMAPTASDTLAILGSQSTIVPPNTNADVSRALGIIEANVSSASGDPRRLDIALLSGSGPNAREVMWRNIFSSSAYAADSYHRWMTASAERMRIDSVGRVGIGRTAPAGRLHVDNGATPGGIIVEAGGNEGAMLTLRNRNKTSSAQANDWIIFNMTGGYGDSLQFWRYSLGTSCGGGDICGRVLTLFDNGNAQFTGSVTAAGFVNASDERLKTNIRDIESGLDSVRRLRAVSYDWLDESTHALQGRQIGFIAQEIEGELPELVSTGDDGIKAVAYGQLTAVLVKALQESDARIEALIAENQNAMAKIKRLSAENSDLLSRVEALELR